MITPSAVPALTMNATPFAAPVPLGGFRLIWPTTFAAVVEVVLAPVAGAVEDCVELPAAAAEALEAVLARLPPLIDGDQDDDDRDDDDRADHEEDRAAEPRARPVARPREGGGPLGLRTGAARGLAGPARVPVPRRSPRRFARAVPSGISGSGLLATGASSEASTRAHARSYGDSASRSRVCSATRSGSWPSR